MFKSSPCWGSASSQAGELSALGIGELVSTDSDKFLPTGSGWFLFLTSGKCKSLVSNETPSGKSLAPSEGICSTVRFQKVQSFQGHFHCFQGPVKIEGFYSWVLVTVMVMMIFLKVILSPCPFRHP